MRFRLLFVYAAALCVQLSLVRCGPLTPSISKFTANKNESTSSQKVVSEAELENIDIEWVQKVNKDEVANNYPLSRTENADLLDVLKSSGEVYLPVSPTEISKIEVCCVKNKKKPRNIELKVKNAKHSPYETKLEITENLSERDSAETTEISEIRIHIKEVID
jgi:hypothetical protein